MFIIEHYDSVSIGQMSLAMLESCLSAARGADLRFQELKKQRLKIDKG